MDSVASLVLELINAEGNAADDPSCRLEFLKLDNTCILRAEHVQFPPQHTFRLPAFPQAANLRCFVTPSLYRMVQSNFFTLEEGKAMPVSALLLRDPNRWEPIFKPWSLLPDSFKALKTVLENRYLKLKHGPDIGVITAPIFDGMTSPAAQLAKMALLNLYAVLVAVRDPINAQPWFSMVEEILVVDRERFVAVASPQFYQHVVQILGDPGRYRKEGFYAADSSLHYDNIPSEYVLQGGMVSVKCRYEAGNLQFTMAKANHATRGECWLLDCDMDEHSNLIMHIGDVFAHNFSGGTHPIDIREYIVHHQVGVDLGYDVRPAAAAAARAGGAD